MTYADDLDLIASESALLAAAVAAGDPAAEVVSCPGWTLATVADHLQEVQTSWAEIVRRGPAESHPAEHPPALADLAAATDQLVQVLRETPPERGCWVWWGEPGSAAAVARHQVHEAAVHRWDAEVTAGVEVHPLPRPEEGLAELLAHDLVSGAGAWLLPTTTVAVIADAGPSWQVHLGIDGLAVEPGAEGEVTLHGTAEDLMLVLWRRMPLSAVRVEGDREVAQALVELARFD